MSSQPPGLVGVLSGDLARYGWFMQSLVGLSLPSGSEIVFCQGLWIASAVNRLIASMAPHHQWICLMADDHIFQPALVYKLLDHQCDIVAPLCCLRRLPYAPSLFHDTPVGFTGYTWQELAGERGLLRVDAMGGPGVVLRRRVIEAVGAPWFECMPGERVAPHEDLYFFRKCRDAGFQPYVDLDLPIGHIIPGAVYPQRMLDSSYAIRLWSYDNLALLTPVEGVQPVEEYHAVT